MKAIRHPVRGMALVSFAVIAVMLGVAMGAPSVAGAPGTGTSYRVFMINPGEKGLATNCASLGDVDATLQNMAGTYLHANGADLNLNLVNTGVSWTRKYDAGKGTGGSFSGCFGVTASLNGNLFIFFETSKGISTVRFTWHFEYVIQSTPSVREHFTMTSPKLPFPAWTGGTIEGRVQGQFDLQYYLREGKTLVSNYESLTGGLGVPFAFTLKVEKKVV